MKIQFINHASFVLENNGVKVLSDPWLFGTAFNNGWDLLCDSNFSGDQFADINYIWFSHEHPDHFSPPVIQKIPEDIRKNITVLFQTTKDKKVLNYCTKLGFKVLELKSHKKIDLGGGIEVMCGPVLFFDSWLCFFVDGKKILNVNDCIVDGEVKAKKIAKYTGNDIDVLFTQFSYAAWKGSPNDQALRKESAKNKLEIMQKQMHVFNPKYTIPFASYVYFSHVENKYLNDGINKPEDARDTIIEGGSTPIVMFPGDVWDIGTNWDNERPIISYKKEYDDIPNKPYRTAEKTYSEDELLQLSKKYIKTIKDKNNFLLIKTVRNLSIMGFFKPFSLYVFDLDKCFMFDIKKGLYIIKNKEYYDIRIHSESLAYVFKFDWGFDTLTVNGRFEADMVGFSKMVKNFAIGPLNNTGKTVGLSLLFDFEFVLTFLSRMKDFILKMKRTSASKA